jgi:hypothetical protein
MTPETVANHVANIRSIYRMHPDWQRLDRLHAVAAAHHAPAILADLLHIQYTVCEEYIAQSEVIDVIDYDDIRRAFCEHQENAEHARIKEIANFRQANARAELRHHLAALDHIAARLAALSADVDEPIDPDSKYLDPHAIDARTLAREIAGIVEFYAPAITTN